MRTISRTTKFKKDYKREAKGQQRVTLDTDLLAAVSLLAADQILPETFHDHLLTGEYTNHRECHLKPDLLLIYKKPDNQTLRLVRLGSHSELFCRSLHPVERKQLARFQRPACSSALSIFFRTSSARKTGEEQARAVHKNKAGRSNTG
jgi:mRNA interferase YafQ